MHGHRDGKKDSAGKNLLMEKRRIIIYLLCIDTLHAYGEKAWPQHVRFVWSYCERQYDHYIKTAKELGQKYEDLRR